MKYSLPIMLMLLLAGFALRIYRLGTQSLWYDETVSAMLAKKTIPDLLAHTARDIHPPGYYLLLHGWTRLAGESEFALAYFSLIFGVLLIASVYLLGHKLINQPSGVWSAALVTCSAYNLWYSQEVRMYTLGAFLGIIAVYCMVAAITDTHPLGHKLKFGSTPTGAPDIEAPYFSRIAFTIHQFSARIWAWRNRFWTGYILAATIGLYCLYYLAFLLIPLNLFALASLVKSTHSKEGQTLPSFTHYLVSFRPWFIANLSIVILYLPWLDTAWRQATNPPVPPWRGTFSLVMMLTQSWTVLSFGESIRVEQIWPLLLLTLGTFVLGLIAIPRLQWRLLLPTLLWGALLIIYLLPILNLTGPLYHVRYIFTYASIFYLILGTGLAWLWQTRRWLTILISLSIAIGNGFAIQELHTNSRYASDDLRGAVALIQQKWRPGDIILVNAGYAYTALQVYFDEPIDTYTRLTDFNVQYISPTHWHPTILMTGTINGAASLGWGDPQSDFYAMSPDETIQALESINRIYPRLWLLRIYDTVTDPQGLIRNWLTNHMLLFEDQVFTGNANMRVQGFMSQHFFTPLQTTRFTLEDAFILHGFTPPASQYRSGERIDVALWWQTQSALNILYALSLKLWDNAGQVAAQTEPDEWPVGNRYRTTDWQPEMIIRYPQRLVLPETIRAGQYWLNVVLYDATTGEPLIIEETGERSILLGGVQIIESNSER